LKKKVLIGTKKVTSQASIQAVNIKVNKVKNQMDLVKRIIQGYHTLRIRLKKNNQAATASLSSCEDPNLHLLIILPWACINQQKQFPEGHLKNQLMIMNLIHLMVKPSPPTWP